MRAFLAVLCWLAACLASLDARAEITRYAVVVGNDAGHAGEIALHYAEEDARKVFEVLSTLGDFRRENMVLLQGKSGSELARVLISMNARIRSESSAGHDAVLFVYYSGHADAGALHLGEDALELGLVQRLVQGSPADFRILVLDACRSGALTRVKGGHAVAPFPLSIDTELSGEGLAMLTSSAADEDAQESDELRGSFFTHYFVSGLRGAADRNGDGSVSVEEAYAHAYQNTLRASSQTLYGMQHPTFRFDLKGRGALPLTWVARRDGATARLALPPGRTYVLFSGDESGPVVAEVGQHDAQRVLALEAGRYFVRGRAREHLLEGLLELAPGQTSTLQESQLSPVEYARLARKGGTERALSHGPWLGYQLRSPLWSEASQCQGVRGGYALDLPQVSLSLALGACRSSFHNDVLHANADEFGLDVSAAHVWDFSALSVSLGGVAGMSWLHESFATRGRAPDRDSVALSVGAAFATGYELSHGFHLLVQALGQVNFFDQLRPEGALATPTLRLTVGAGKRF